MSGTPFSNVNNIHAHSMIPEDQKKRPHNDVVSHSSGLRNIIVLINVHGRLQYELIRSLLKCLLHPESSSAKFFTPFFN